MAIEIQAILTDGYEKTIARTGLVFAGLFYVLSVLSTLFSPEVEPFPAEEMPVGDVAPAAGGQPYAPSLGLPAGVAGILSLLVGAVTLVVTIGAIRTFVYGDTEEIPREYFEHNLLWAAVNLFVGAFVFGLTVAIGFVFLIVPGLFLLVSLFFWEIFVAVEDENFIEGLQHSWTLTSGHRLQLFVLGVVAVLVALVVSIVFAIPGAILPDFLGFLVTQAGDALLSVFFLASIAETYHRLVDMADEGDAATQAM